MVSCIDHNPIGNYFSWCQIYLFMLWTMALQQRIWNSSGSEQREEISHEARGIQEQTIGFSIKNAVLFPPEVEKGTWPEDYSLSDHARLTVVFSPIRMPCSQSLSWQTSGVKELRCKTCTEGSQKRKGKAWRLQIDGFLEQSQPSEFLGRNIFSFFMWQGHVRWFMFNCWTETSSFL